MTSDAHPVVPTHEVKHVQQDSSTGICLLIDFLYWQASQTGMSYGLIYDPFSPISVPGASATRPIGSNKNIDFQFDPGVRVSLGFKPYHDDWRIDFIWTELNTKASGVPNLSGAFFAASFIPYFNTPQLLNNNGANAKAEWRAYFNTLDLDLHREISFVKRLTLSGHLGLRNLWLDQKYNVLSINTYNGTHPPTIVCNSEAKMKEDIWGIGPMIGGDSIWNLYRGFSLFGKAMFSMMWSHVKSSNLGISFFTPPLVTLDRTSNFHTLMPEIDVSLGGIYDISFSQDRYRLRIKLAWELQKIYHTNFFNAQYTPQGNFSLNGVTGGFTFTF